jgi:hypothetical protein
LGLVCARIDDARGAVPLPATLPLLRGFLARGGGVVVAGDRGFDDRTGGGQAYNVWRSKAFINELLVALAIDIAIDGSDGQPVAPGPASTDDPLMPGVESPLPRRCDFSHHHG